MAATSQSIPGTDSQPNARFPKNVRLQIYEIYLSKYRILEPKFGHGHWMEYEKPTFYRTTPKEPLLATCHETREVALKHGYFVFRAEGQTGIYMRQVDILFLNLEALIALSMVDMMFRHYPYQHEGILLLKSMRSVQNVAIEWGAQVDSHGLGAMCPRLAEWLPNVKNVYLTLPCVRYTTVSSADEPVFIKTSVAKLYPLPGRCVMPKFTKPGDDEHTEGETWDICGRDIIRRLRDFFSRSDERRDINIRPCFLFRAPCPKCPTSGTKDFLVYHFKTFEQRQITISTFNNVVASK